MGTTREKLADKLYITRIGKIRIIDFNGVGANATTGVYYSGLPAADCPYMVNVYNMALYQNSGGVTYPGYVQVASSGVIVGRYYTVAGQVQVTSWPTFGILVYTVA